MQRRAAVGKRSSPAFEEDIDALLRDDPRHAKERWTGLARREGGLPNGVVLDAELRGGPARCNVLVSLVVREHDEAIHAALPGLEAAMDGVHRGDRKGGKARAPIAAVAHGRKR